MQTVLLIVLISELNRTISFLKVGDFVPVCHILLNKQNLNPLLKKI